MDGKQQILGQYQQILSFWPAPSEFHHIGTEFGDTFVIESGSKEGHPLVLLHGSASNSSMWLGDAAVLGQTHEFLRWTSSANRATVMSLAYI
jgi:pimeloyl-ACP methyl ester carboxylesterase